MKNRYDYKKERKILAESKAISKLVDIFYRSFGKVDGQEIRKAVINDLKVKHGINRSQAYLLWKCYHSQKVSRRSKKARLEKKIRSWYEEGFTVFLTLTYSTEFLAGTSALNRRKKVREVLNQCCRDYVANVDYGKTTGREHYHAVGLGVDGLKLKALWGDRYGFIKCEAVIPDTEGSLFEYVDKLCNHALKESAGLSQLIYCRKRKKHETS